ncbi:MAG TPA: class I SAM-dependent methyltransferase, partial [Acidobacteriaceae bacterium]
ASRRAAHQILDHAPLVLNDPIAVPLLGPDFFADPVRHSDPRSVAFRALMVGRSRFVEDYLALAVAAGVSQYVILGAGLDTFAYRNPFPALRVFEVDYPSTQHFKRTLLAKAAIPEPASLTFVPHDFEHQTLAAALSQTGFDASKPAFFSWLGVIPYLTHEAFRTTIRLVAAMPPSSGIALDYSLAAEELSPRMQAARKSLAQRVAAAGEPFQLFFRSEQMEAELSSAGFHRIEQVDAKELNRRYFSNRTDSLQLPEEGLAKLAVAWV